MSTCEEENSPGISPMTTSTPKGPAGEAWEIVPSGPRSRVRREFRVVDHSASWGPTGEEAVAVDSPTSRETAPVSSSRTRVRVTLRKATLRASHQRLGSATTGFTSPSPSRPPGRRRGR